MLLIVSFSATTAVAFADGETEKYTVTYSVGDTTRCEGTAPSASSYAANAKVTLLSSTTFKPKKGYEFAGWLVEDQAEALAAGKTFDMPAKNITVTAQWKTVHEVTINQETLNSLLMEDDFFKYLKVEMGEITFGKALMKDATTIKTAFEGIKYYDDDDTENGIRKSDNDKVYIEYCRPSESPKGQETWQNSSVITSSIRLSSAGWYTFRIVVKDSTGVNVLATSTKFSRYAEDTKNPVVSLSTAMKDKIESGLTEGVKYTVSTSLSITDSSSTTVTYKIYKKVKGEWTTEPIYDSETKKVAEGYEKFIDENGAITPSKEDISDEPVYRITYAVKDANGYIGVENEDSKVPFSTPMDLKVVAAPAENKPALNPWEIVLFCIAGAAFIGIIVLLFIKPKQPAPERQAAVKADEADVDTTTENTEE